MYSKRTVFDRRPKPTKTPIFRPQQIREIVLNSVKHPKMELLRVSENVSWGGEG